ncbi:MAG: hypothetical protein IPH96_14085 [Saprospiraceae bacterium]|nr:hypothetical protein [Saprospiraceae bacterium]
MKVIEQSIPNFSRRSFSVRWHMCFDIQKYGPADSIMKNLAAMQYKYISPSNKAP